MSSAPASVHPTAETTVLGGKERIPRKSQEVMCGTNENTVLRGWAAASLSLSL